LTAKATDDKGAVTTSTARTITIEGTVVSGNVYYIHTDHLETPREITNEQNQTVWKNPPLTEPFGNTPVDDDPDGDGQVFTFNLRFPGQYYDQETGTHYNYFRDNYLPDFGRYGQSDPIGLRGGINTYGYVRGNPLSLIDFLGLLGFSREECERILKEIEREWENIETVNRILGDLKPYGPLPMAEDYGLGGDADPFGKRGKNYNNSSQTYKNALDKMESDSGFNNFGRLQNLLGGVMAIITDGAWINQQTRVMWLTEMERIYYMINEMKAVYDKECREEKCGN
jgi:RHS repeat-associated protein